MFNARSHRIFGSIAGVVLAAAVCGCAGPGASGLSGSPATTPSPATAEPVTAAGGQLPAHAECLVCKHNADLACVDVPVDRTTPTAQYNGRTYYFCSDECRNEFHKHPEKYAADRH